jgi:hypothetical protein
MNYDAWYIEYIETNKKPRLFVKPRLKEKCKMTEAKTDLKPYMDGDQKLVNTIAETSNTNTTAISDTPSTIGPMKSVCPTRTYATHKEFLEAKIDDIELQLKDVEHKFLTANIVRDTNFKILHELKESIANQLERINTLPINPHIKE